MKNFEAEHEVLSKSVYRSVHNLLLDQIADLPYSLSLAISVICFSKQSMQRRNLQRSI